MFTEKLSSKYRVPIGTYPTYALAHTHTHTHTHTVSPTISILHWCVICAATDEPVLIYYY